VFCPNCGRKIEAPAATCPTCQALLPDNVPLQPATAAGSTEQELLRFGPFGVSIARKRPGVFVPVMKNCTEVVVTDRRLIGLRKPGCLAPLLGCGSGPTFDVPWTEVMAAERADFLGNRAIWFQYRSGGQTAELAVIAALTCHAALERLWSVVQQRAAGQRT